MIASLIVAFLFLTLHRRLLPDPVAIHTLMTGPEVPDLNLHLVMRKTLPTFALASASITAFTMFFLHMAGIAAINPWLSSMIIFGIGGFKTGILISNSIRAAEYLVVAEKGVPDPDLRKGLLDELLLFPLLPLATATALAGTIP